MSRVGPKFNATGVLMRIGDRHTGKSSLCGDRGRDWNDAPINQRMPRIVSKHQKLGERESMAWPTP